MHKSLRAFIAVAVYSLAMPSNSLANPINLATLLRLPENRSKGHSRPSISSPVLDAMAFIESSNRPNAIAYNPKGESKHGKMGSAAHGLLQVRGLWAGTEICPEAKTWRDLYRVNINKKCGSRLLQYELDKVGGDLALGLAAYNGGPKCIRKGEIVCAAAKTYSDRVIMRIAYELRRE